jgi:hypothetical protein
MVGKMLSSVMDKPVASNKSSVIEKASTVTYAIPGRETKAAKQAMLASNDPCTG